MTLGWKALKREARRKGTPPERLLELAKMGPELTREIVRSNNTSPEILAQLVEIYPDDEFILRRIAEHQNTSAETLKLLAAKLPWSVARNRNAPTSLLRQLSKHPNSSVYEAVLYNPSTPVDVVEQLTKILESRPQTLAPREVLVQYGKGTKYFDDFLLRNIERADLIPAEAALSLSQHPNPEIHEALLQNAEKITASVRSQIISQLQGETP